MQMMSPVRDLLVQWLLMPLFADIVMAVLVLRSVRNRAGYALAALLALLALRNAAATWPGSPGAAQIEAACAAMVPATVCLFMLSYAGGRRLAGPRIWRALAIVLPAAAFAAFAIAAKIPSGSPAIPAFSLLFFGATISFLLLSGASRALVGGERELFLTGLMLIVGAGVVYDLILPFYRIDLPLYSYFSAAAGAVFLRATLRYKGFSATSAAEGPWAGAAPPPRGIFLTRQGEGGRARAMLVGAARSGLPGVIVTRAHPAAVRRQTGLARTPVIWLANSPYEKCLPPASVEVLSHAIRDMGEQAAGCVVLIEDLDYLVANAGLFPTMGMLEEVRGQAERASMTVLLSSDLLTDEERRELIVIGVRLLPRDAGAPSRA